MIRRVLYVALEKLRLQAGHQCGEESRHLHLRDAENLADLGLGRVMEEPQLDHLPFSVGQPREHGSQDQPGVHPAELVVLRAERVADGSPIIAQGCVQGRGGEAAVAWLVNLFGGETMANFFAAKQR